MASKAFCVLSTCFLLLSHSAASFVKRELLMDWFAIVIDRLNCVMHKEYYGSGRGCWGVVGLRGRIGYAW